MRQVDGYALWIGHVGDGRDIRALMGAGIEAVVDLAVNEAAVALPREIVHCRFPLVDGEGNPAWLLRLAAEAVAALVRAEVPTLVCCSAVMSRSPAIAAAGISLARGLAPEEALAIVAARGGGDVLPGLWGDVVGAIG